MTKRDYELIAEGFRAARNMPRPDNRVIDECAKDIAFRLKLDNPNFNEIKFLIACGNIR